MRIWLIIIASGIVTYLTRASFILFGDRIPLPAMMQRSLSFVAPAAFAAIAAPLILGGGEGPALVIPRIAAAVIAAAAVWKTRNIPAGLVAGMCVLWTLTAVF